MSKEYPQMSVSQRARAKELVRQECCNYLDGMCVVLENGYGDTCVQCISNHVFCRWFRDAVLPLDEELQNELYPRVRGKPCMRCGTLFVPGSNRARFCTHCAVINRKRYRAEWVYRKRHSSEHLGSAETP